MALWPEPTALRMALLAEPAFVLSVAVALEAIAYSWGRAAPRALALGLLLLCVAVPPYAQLLARARAPLGAVPRRLVEQLQALDVPVKRRGCVHLSVLGEWSDFELASLRVLSAGALAVPYPGRQVELLIERRVRRRPAAGCDVSLELTRDGMVQLPGGRKFPGN